MAFNQNKILRGTFGKLWVNNEKMANIKSFEAKVTGDYESVNVAEDFGEKQRYMGYSISGTMTFHKYDSKIASIYKDAFETGVIPEITLIAAIDDPSVDGVERVALYDVTFDEFTLGKFEGKTILEEEVPFKAGSYKYLDLIEEE